MFGVPNNPSTFICPLRMTTSITRTDNRCIGYKCAWFVKELDTRPEDNIGQCGVSKSAEELRYICRVMLNNNHTRTRYDYD